MSKRIPISSRLSSYLLCIGRESDSLGSKLHYTIDILSRTINDQIYLLVLGFCAIDYSESASTTPDPFNLGATSTTGLSVGIPFVVTL